MEVVLIDLPGRGRSLDPPCDSVEHYRESVYKVLRRQNLFECYIAGHSLGGAIALSLAQHYPELTKGIILMGTGAKLKVLPDIFEQIATNRERAVEFITAIAFSPHAPPHLREYAVAETLKADQNTLHCDFLACDRFDIRDTISSINTPSLVLCGDDDALTPPRYSEFLHKFLARSELQIIENAGHMLMLEKPLEVNTVIQRFVEQNS